MGGMMRRFLQLLMLLAIGAAKRGNPSGKIDDLLDLFSRVRALGDDQRWIETWCDGGFFPLSYFSNKR
jgi:hypothetical protein